MSEQYFSSILTIPNFDDATLKEAKRIFNAYAHDRHIIYGCVFEDNLWHLTDEYATYSLDFNITTEEFETYSEYLKMDVSEFIDYLKTYIVYKMGELIIGSLQEIVNGVKKVISYPIDELESSIEETSYSFPLRIAEFFSLIPAEGISDEIEDITDAIEMLNDVIRTRYSSSQRQLSEFYSYFIFMDVLDAFWKECSDEDEKVFFFPVYMWWKVTGVLPLRPREFVLTPRECLYEVDGKWELALRKNRIKGSGKKKSYKIDKDYIIKRYQIPEELARDIMWYIGKTEDDMHNDLDTLFRTEYHYKKWDRRAPSVSRYFTYTNLNTCLRYFFQEIIHERYGYTIVFDRQNKQLRDNEIQYLNLGDTRHLSMINIIAEGATPTIAMLLADHDNPEMSSHYYGNISTMIECMTYRQYKRIVGKDKKYSLSKPISPIQTKKYVVVEKGRCYSPAFCDGKTDDCEKVIGPGGEIGDCAHCRHYRFEGKTFEEVQNDLKNQILNECRTLEEVVKLVRAGKGYNEDIVQVMLNLRNKEFSYQQFLEETMEERNGKEEIN